MPVSFEISFHWLRATAHVHQPHGAIGTIRFRYYPPPASLITRKASLLWSPGNSVGKRLNFLPIAEEALLSRARNRQVSLYFPLEHGNQRAENGSLMTASSVRCCWFPREYGDFPWGHVHIHVHLNHGRGFPSASGTIGDRRTFNMQVG